MIKGLGMIKNTVIVPHYTERKRQEALVQLMKQAKVAYGIGIDCMTAIEFELDKFPNEYRKIGAGAIEIKKI
jgi:cyanophycinase-like exopeptidase